MAYEYQFRGLYLEDFEVGKEYFSPARTVTEADVSSFAGLSGDFNPLHMDEEFAKKNSSVPESRTARWASSSPPA